MRIGWLYEGELDVEDDAERLMEADAGDALEDDALGPVWLVRESTEAGKLDVRTAEGSIVARTMGHLRTSDNVDKIAVEQVCMHVGEQLGLSCITRCNECVRSAVLRAQHGARCAGPSVC